jgi:hypothetical protein
LPLSHDLDDNTPGLSSTVLDSDIAISFGKNIHCPRLIKERRPALTTQPPTFARLCSTAVFVISVLTAGAIGHPLDELSDTPYQAHAPESLDVAVSLERNHSIELGFYIDLNSLLQSEFSPTEVKLAVSESPSEPLSKAAILFAQTHVMGLVELYVGMQLQSGTLSFRELKDSGVLPDDGKVWSQISYDIGLSTGSITLVVNALVKTVQVGIIDVVDSTKSRLVRIEKETPHTVLIRGEDIPSLLDTRPDVLKARFVDSISVSQTILNYLKLGFVHIVPKGLDHILFVLALFLLSTQLRILAIQISIFTLAHTLTLALASMKIVELPASLIEPLIALSITYVAVENLSRRSLKRSRMLVIFVFGMLHGLGFAGVLAQLGLSNRHFFTSLISFNIGVELGQLSVLSIAVILLRWTQSHAWYTTRVVKPISVVIAMTGLFWGIERLTF